MCVYLYIPKKILSFLSKELKKKKKMGEEMKAYQGRVGEEVINKTAILR